MASYRQLPPPPDVEAGWKIDPLNNLQYRWWDGRGWTDHAGVGQAPAQPAAKSALRADIEMAGQRMQLTVGAKREIARLRDVLRDDERVFEMARGDLNSRTGLIVLTDQRFLFLSDDASSSHEEYYPLDSVTGIWFNGGMMSGDLTISLTDHQLRFTSVSKKDGKRLTASSQRFLQDGSSQPTAKAGTEEPLPAPEAADTKEPFKLLRSGDAFWRRSNMMGVLNTDLAKQLEADSLGARLWRIEPGQASTRHRHRDTTEVYVLLEGTGKLRVGNELLELRPMDSVKVEPGAIRQPFNDTDTDQLWLVFGAPNEFANTNEMSEDDINWLYPDGPRTLPPELT